MLNDDLFAVRLQKSQMIFQMCLHINDNSVDVRKLKHKSTFLVSRWGCEIVHLVFHVFTCRGCWDHEGVEFDLVAGQCDLHTLSC